MGLNFMPLARNQTKPKSCVFIVPRSSYSWKGNEAGWISVAGWANAAKELWEEVFIGTTDGVFSPEEVRSFPRKRNEDENILYSLTRRFIPEVLITAVKDLRLKVSKPIFWAIEKDKNFSKTSPQLVWQRHDLFSGPGYKLSKKYNIPLVTSVEALVVWEAEKWGVHRPIWGKWLERRSELKSLKKSDLICCISEEVQEKIISLGVSRSKVVVTSNKVDPRFFHPLVDGSGIREEFDLKDKLVIGWAGSFRKFHGLEDVVVAFEIILKKFPQARLLLVGNGLEFDAIQELVSRRNLSDFVILTGRKKIEDIPKYIAAMDIAVVSAKSATGFHYFPLKLAEYMALGKAVIAPAAGDLPKIFRENSDIMFF